MDKSLIAILDYGVGNVGSMANMLKKLEVSCCVTSDPGEIRRADKLILPGVGAFDYGMKKLTEKGLVPILEEEVLGRQKPILGVCLGMQMFAKSSEEGNASGLGWIDGTVARFPTDSGGSLKVPHMGWNTVTPARPDALFQGMPEDARFYFVHSFHLSCPDEIATGHTLYGTRFVAAVKHGNIRGVQFHPEKSHRFGMQLLANFAADS